MHEDLLKAVDLALAGDWDGAHNLVQGCEGDPAAAWIHAVLHKIEGDESNSKYWYRRADKLEHFGDHSTAELESIRAKLAKERGK